MKCVPTASGLVGLTLLTSAIFLNSAAHPALRRTSPPPVDLHAAAAIDELRRAATAGPNGEHLARLFALRQLRDPALRLLFQQLRRQEEWTLQVHGSLGLAELGNPPLFVPRLDPELLDGLGPDASTTLIATALDRELTDASIRLALVEHDALSALPRLLLVARMIADDSDPARAAGRRTVGAILDRLDQSKLDRSKLDPEGQGTGDPALPSTRNPSHDPRIALLATCLARQLELQRPTDSPTLAQILTNDPNRASGQRRARELRGLKLWLLDQIRTNHLDTLMPWVETVLSNPETPRATRNRAVMTALVLDPVAGQAAWERLIGPAPRYVDRVRFALLMLMTGKPMPASAATRLTRDLPEDDTIVRAILALDLARQQNAPLAPPLIDLLALHHPAITEWILSRLETAPSEIAIPVCRHLIRNGLAGSPTPESVELAVLATNRLYELAPDEVLQRLLAVEDDDAGQEILLLGLFDHRDPAIGRACAALPRIGSGRADSLSLLLIARYADDLTDDDQRRLGMIAAGGGRVSAGLRTQAAWLYLQHIGAAPEALRVVSAETP